MPIPLDFLEKTQLNSLQFLQKVQKVVLATTTFILLTSGWWKTLRDLSRTVLPPYSTSSHLPLSAQNSNVLLPFSHSFGFECTKRNNLRPIDGGKQLLHSNGTFVQLLDLATMQQSYLKGLDGRGVGAIAVSTHFAFDIEPSDCVCLARSILPRSSLPSARRGPTLQCSSTTSRN